MVPSQSHIVVLGAGIVGTCCALELKLAGYDVTLVDRDGPSSGCSSGNAGIIATETVLPVASPDILLKVPKMLLSARGPLSIRWRYLPTMLPWLIRFVAAARGLQAEASARAIAQLQITALQDHLNLAEKAGCQELLRTNGWLEVYASEQAYAAAQPGFDAQRRHGVRVEPMGADGIAERAPALQGRIQHGVYFPDAGWTVNSQRYGEQLAAHFRALGGRLLQADIRGIQPRDHGVCVRTHGGKLAADAVVVAMGAWSNEIARQLDEGVPLDTERGYHVSLPNARPALEMPVMFADYKIVASPTARGLRLAGTAEFAGVAAPPNYARAERILEIGRELFPNLDEQDADYWMGCRPTLPDSLPVLGQSAKHAGIYYAFGHQHIGLTLAAVSGRLMRELVTEGEASMDLSPYRVDRF